MQATMSPGFLGSVTENHLFSLVRDRVAWAFDVRQVVVFVNKRGRLCPLGQPSSHSLLGAARLLASLNMRVDANDPAGSEVPAPTILRAVPRSGRGSIMAAPLVHRGRTLGLLVVEGQGTRNFDREDLRHLTGIAGMCASALLAEASLAGTAAANEAWDIDDAMRLQRTFLPRPLPPNSELIVHAVYEPVAAVGGDFYDIIHLGPAQFGVLIGDVSGHGIPAALLMARVSAELRNHAVRGAAPAELLAAANSRYADRDGEMFVTAAYARIDVAAGRALIANAGHVPPILRRADGHTAVVGHASGTPLGMFLMDYEDSEVPFGPGDILLFVTDGLFDAFGLQRLRDEAASAPPHAKGLAEAVHAAANADIALYDDVTIVAAQSRLSARRQIASRPRRRSTRAKRDPE
jgi:hypothetical protein